MIALKNVYLVVKLNQNVQFVLRCDQRKSLYGYSLIFYPYPKLLLLCVNGCEHMRLGQVCNHSPDSRYHDPRARVGGVISINRVLLAFFQRCLRALKTV